MIQVDLLYSNPVVMVVDDDPMNIFLLSELLNSKSIECDKALRGQAAIDKIK